MPSQKPPWHNDNSHVEVEEVDLTEPNVDDRLLAREQEELLKLQRPDGQEKPKLADFKCVICLDDPTDLAATPCGEFLIKDTYPTIDILYPPRYLLE